MSPDDHFDLSRFRAAQDPVFAAVLAELRSGHKQTHWMWFIFPQLRGLGHSPTAQFYAIASRAEALAYLADPVLGARLQQATQAMLDVAGKSAHAILGAPDDLKFHSSMTLFAAVAGATGAPFRAALDRYFAGAPDPRTLSLLSAHP